ncbi:hypothetical protein MUY35_08335 [Aliiroseovarius sp. S1339]|uniref:c-type cytochrome n=1 Tax=Aliiroseovarius sp. S1339 TaxID=2936990 RepID=UPI0020C05F05|nr:hypothetical protein [Aliiroseovarius sp. S1339]MCK8463853.1 hypothetical protein [Aliiroseovarius sp. S1339]
MTALKPKIGVTVVAVLSSVLFGGMANAQDISFGKILFERSCTVCHGTVGLGDGDIGQMFQERPSNLQLLAKNNDGIFPLERVYNSISGVREIQGHGDRNMPVWGSIYEAEATPKAFHPGISAEEIVHGRILSLVYYLQSIQQ